MAVPTFTHDLTTINNADATTGWVTITAAMLSVVDGLQGAGAILNSYAATGSRGTAYDRGAGLGINMTGQVFYIWMQAGGAGFVNTKANGGMWVHLASEGTNVTTNYKRWYVGGSDIDWVKDGGWRRIVLNPSTTSNVTVGTFDITNVRWFGGGSEVILAAMTGGTIIDILHYGTKFEITGGSDSDPIAFQGVVDKDSKAVDDTLYGVVSKNNKANSFEVNGTLLIGDEGGTSTTVFKSVGESVIFADQPVSSTGISLVSKQDTGATTKILIGDSTGSGESKVGFGGTTFNHFSTVFGIEPIIDFSASINTLGVYGSIFKGLGRGMIFGTNTAHEVISNTFDSCSQIGIGRVIARDLLFTGYTSNTAAALLWNDNINIKRSRFFANTHATNDPAAIEHPSAAGSPYTYDALKFAGNDFDVNNTSGSAITVNLTNVSDASTSKGSSVTFSTASNLLVRVKDTANNPVNLAQVAIFKASDDTSLMNEDTDASGNASEGTTESGNIYIRVRKSTIGDTRYVPFSTTGTISGDFTLDVTLREDTNA